MEPLDMAQISELIERSERIVQEARRLNDAAWQFREVSSFPTGEIANQTQRHLTLASTCVSDGKQRIKDQEALIARLAKAGSDTHAAETFLRLLHLSLDTMRGFKQLTAHEYLQEHSRI